MRRRMLNGGYAASRCERTFIGSFVRRSFWKARLSRRARALRKFPSYRQYRRWNERALCKFEEGRIGKKGRTLDAKARPLASSWTRARFARSCIARREVKWKFTQASNRNSQCETQNRKHEYRFFHFKGKQESLLPCIAIIISIIRVNDYSRSSPIVLPRRFPRTFTRVGLPGLLRLEVYRVLP